MPSFTGKGLFLELAEQSILAARTSHLGAPFVLEALGECAMGEEEDMRLWLCDFLGTSAKRGQFIPAICSVFPPNRFVRRGSIDNPARSKDPSFFPEFVKQQFKIDVSSNLVAVMNATRGSEFRLDAEFSKELVFCGAPSAELLMEQEQIQALGIYPQRVEVGTLSAIGGLARYQAATNIQAPTLMLELTPDVANVFVIQGDTLDVARAIPYGLNSMYPIVQKELGLKDEASAKRLFGTNTFDFTEMGPVLLKKLIKELQASTGFYEVQTGQTIGGIFLTQLPANLQWISSILSKSLGIDEFTVDAAEFCASEGIEVDSSLDLSSVDRRWFGLLSLMAVDKQSIAKKEASRGKEK